MTSWSFWRLRLIELTVAILVTAAIIQIVEARNAREERRERVEREQTPVSAWFEVNEVFVPDHEVGEDPVVIYDRTVHERVVGFWIAEVQRLGENGALTNVCPGSGVAEYDPGEALDAPSITLSWYMDRQCNLGPGQYRIKTVYTFSKPDWPDKELTTASNVFTVSES